MFRNTKWACQACMRTKMKNYSTPFVIYDVIEGTESESREMDRELLNSNGYYEWLPGRGGDWHTKFHSFLAFFSVLQIIVYPNHTERSWVYLAAFLFLCFIVLLCMFVYYITVASQRGLDAGEDVTLWPPSMYIYPSPLIVSLLPQWCQKWQKALEWASWSEVLRCTFLCNQALKVVICKCSGQNFTLKNSEGSVLLYWADFRVSSSEFFSKTDNFTVK